MTGETHERRSWRRLVVVGVAVVLGASLLAADPRPATGRSFPPPTPAADCGPGAREETDIQGRVPQADYESGRVEKGYRCNTRPVAGHGSTGGFKVQRYRDDDGRVCAFYDSTLLFPKDTLMNPAEGIGVVVLDMTDPRKPRQTAMLTTPAMESPHESLLLNRRRGLLAATLGNAATNVGVLDVYDVRDDCREPRLLSSTPVALLGHESGWSRDGLTFWAASTAGQTLVALDLTDPATPVPVFEQAGVNYHGLRLSRDGRTMYVANIGTEANGAFASGGLRILDVSEVQERHPTPAVPVLADLTWPEMSIPQVAEPFRRGGRDYLLEVDEFANYSTDAGADQSGAPVGAARIVDVTHPRRPRVVSHLRLAVHQPAARRGEQQDDPGAQSPVQGYAAHYCSVPRYRNPKAVACSMIASGLRLFDIRRLDAPREVGYFNTPVRPGSQPENPEAEGGYAMAQPAWDLRRRSVWYSDGHTGFHVVRLTNGTGRLLRR
ncbi:LVIVD repeat-containing protein [Nocardioides sp. GCM10027113]|uniref:LVIVD repeat-containing protein n=1 Tax=unclassified Nocardioides TaxID=2615069 RepID=UPI0036164B96